MFVNKYLPYYFSVLVDLLSTCSERLIKNLRQGTQTKISIRYR